MPDFKLISESIGVAVETFDMEVQFHGWDGARFPRLAALHQSLLFVLRAVRCAFLGHKWEDQGCAGPESGSIELVCKHCGYSHGRTVLY